MNEPTVSPCWLPVGENHAGARGESRCSTAAKDGSLAPSVRRHPCLELQWGGWATKICPETPPLELLAAVRAERQGFSWNGCRCQGTRGGGLAQLGLQVGTYLKVPGDARQPLQFPQRAWRRTSMPGTARHAAVKLWRTIGCLQLHSGRCAWPWAGNCSRYL